MAPGQWTTLDRSPEPRMAPRTWRATPEDAAEEDLTPDEEEDGSSPMTS